MRGYLLRNFYYMNIDILETDDVQHEDLLALRKKNSFYYHRRKAGKHITIPEMYAIYLKTRKNKRRSEDSVEFEIELEKASYKVDREHQQTNI